MKAGFNQIIPERRAPKTGKDVRSTPRAASVPEVAWAFQFCFEAERIWP
jgi:hypothetical protein